MSNYRSGLRRGLSLIEVVSALALMGSLLVAVIIGAAQHLKQIRQSNEKKAALASIERLLVDWSSFDFQTGKLEACAEQAGVLLLGQEKSSNNQQFTVRVTSKPVDSLEGLELEVVTVEAIRTDGTILTWLEVFRPATSPGDST